MSIYRINFLDAKNTIVDATFGDHDTDEAVLADASGLRGEHHSIEVWCGRRVVGKLPNMDAQAAKRAHALRQIAHSLPGPCHTGRMVTYEVTATGPKGYQVTVISPGWQGAIVGDFSSLSAAETFAQRMRAIDASGTHLHFGDPPPR